MLSDVIVNILNLHMTLYLNIMKAQGFYILLRLFPFSQNRHCPVIFSRVQPEYNLFSIVIISYNYQYAVCTLDTMHAY